MSVTSFLKRLSPRFGPPQIQERIPVIYGGHEAGVTVSHETAMTIATYYRCVRVIADSLSYIDWRVKRRRADGGADIQPNHPVDYLLYKKANPSLTAFQFKELLVSWALVWGNGYAWIDRGKRNVVEALWPIAPWRIKIDVSTQWGVVYEIKSRLSEPIRIPERDMFHLKNLGENGYEGYSVVTLARRSLGLAIATEDHGNSLFGNAARPAGILEHPGKLSAEAKDSIRDDWNRRFQGPGKAWGTAVLQEGMKFNALSMHSEDAQFLETRKFSVIDICRWVGVHPYKAYELDGMKYSNTEHVNRDFHSDTLAPWAKRIEQEADDKLLGQDVTFTDFDFRQLLRGDIAARTAHYSSLFDRGVFSVNDIRIKEGDNPVGSDGDKRFVAMNMQTLDKAGEEIVVKPPPPGQTNEPNADDETKKDDAVSSDDEGLAVMRGLLTDGMLRIMRREKRLAEAAQSKYEDRQEYESAVMVHIGNDSKKAYEDLRSAIAAVGKFACGQPWGWWADFTIKAFLRERETSSLILCVEGFDQGNVTDYLERHELGRANVATEKLFRACMIAANSARSLENGHGN